MKIAIMGSSGGAGKDTVASMIKEVSGRDFETMALGDPIHQTSDELLGRKAERRYLQDYGESARRIFGQNVWINYLDRRIEQKGNPNVIVPDIRKLLEFSHFCVEGEFKPLYVYNTPEIARARLTDRDGGYSEKSMNRNIETQLQFIDDLYRLNQCDGEIDPIVKVGAVRITIIDNSGTLADTKEQVERWWQEVA